MFNTQLEFSRPQNEDNYFINYKHEPNIEQNYINDLHPEKVQTMINNESKQIENNIPYMEQLDFINQRNEPAFIVEKANPLFYNPAVERNQLKKQVKNKMKNKSLKKQKWRPGQNLQRKKIKKPNKKYQTGILNTNNINININNYNNYNN